MDSKELKLGIESIRNALVQVYGMSLDELVEKLTELFNIFRESSEDFENTPPKQYGMSLIKPYRRGAKQQLRKYTYDSHIRKNLPYMRRMYSR